MGEDIPKVARAAVGNDQSLDLAGFSGGWVLDVSSDRTYEGQTALTDLVVDASFGLLCRPLGAFTFSFLLAFDLHHLLGVF